MRLREHPLGVTVRNLRGNPRACLITEPLWGIPYNLYIPYATMYMVALGLNDVELGVLATLSMVFQLIASVFSGVITDKMGRRMVTLIFDLIGWSVPALLWAFAQNFTWFAVAAMFNGIWRVTQNAWGCLLVEDTEEGQLVHLFAFMYLAGLIAGFFAPITFFMVRRFDLIPTMRFLYLLAFVMMTAKFVVLFFWSTETRMGRRRMEETRGQSVLSLLRGCGGVIRMILGNRLTVLTIALWAALTAAIQTTNTFWPLLVTSRIGVPQASLSLLATVRTLVMLVCYLTIVPHLSVMRFRRPMLIGFALIIASQVLLVCLPGGAVGWLVASVVMESLALSILNPLKDSLQMINVDAHERARILGMFQAAVLLVTAPFGYLAGLLSSIYRVLPFLLSMALYALAAVCTWEIARERKRLEE
ncbi:MAG TPA: MFS transporter [Clostridia bacterium]|nr:MFS transporter [Clostridia bacterium]